jgi:hypothetical protein
MYTVVYCLLGSSPASEFYEQTFWNTVSVPSSPIKMEPIQRSEMSAYKIQMPGNYPKENLLHPQHGQSLKTTMYTVLRAADTASFPGL